MNTPSTTRLLIALVFIFSGLKINAVTDDENDLRHISEGGKRVYYAVRHHPESCVYGPIVLIPGTSHETLGKTEPVAIAEVSCSHGSQKVPDAPYAMPCFLTPDGEIKSVRECFEHRKNHESIYDLKPMMEIAENRGVELRTMLRFSPPGQKDKYGRECRYETSDVLLRGFSNNRDVKAVMCVGGIACKNGGAPRPDLARRIVICDARDAYNQPTTSYAQFASCPSEVDCINSEQQLAPVLDPKKREYYRRLADDQYQNKLDKFRKAMKAARQGHR